jgi:diaminohydroxyphosphoribosylaminopyrimidine deaminase/5-amino-6-(5-phosphoribosylamino)uracil reductase
VIETGETGVGESVQVEQAMRRAVVLARRGSVGVNPRVGCVVLDQHGDPVGEGWHEGAGTAHAEVMALRAAGSAARAGTVVVTLEPCAHHGRTGPCVDALVSCGVARVAYGRRDPCPIAMGGADALRSAGVQVLELRHPEALRAEIDGLVERWAWAVTAGRPFVTWKFATTLDGRAAAQDGTSQWITGSAARADVHRLRAEHDTILVGTGTIEADDPRLTARGSDGALLAHQPLRAVMGMRSIPASAQVLNAEARTVLLRTRDPRDAVAQLWDSGSRQVWLEGGPQLAASFVNAGLVDEVIAYVTPALLGAGPAAIDELGRSTIGQALRLELTDVASIEGDVRLTARFRTGLTKESG